MAYQSVHSGPAIDAAVTQLADIQIVRDESNANLATVQNLAAQVATDAGTASTAAASATQTLNDATAAIAAADHTRQEQIDAEIAIVADQRFAAEQAATEAVAAADAAVVTVTQDMAASMPTPNKLPLADAQGRIASDWLGADIARGDALAAADGSGLVGFQQEGAGAVARTVLDKAREVVSVDDFGADPTGLADSSAAIQGALDYALSVSGEVVARGTYLCSSGIFVKSGLFHINFTGARLIFDSSVTAAVTIGEAGSNPYRGTVRGLRIEKETYAGGDAGFYIANAVEVHIDSPRAVNFSKAMDWSGAASSRVAYLTITNPLFQNHEYGIYAQPVATSYCNENTVLGGRFQSGVSGRLKDHIHLDNVNSGGTSHNRFIGISIEGWSGGGATGDAAVRCINNANENLFFYCRGERYGAGWTDATYCFGVGTARNRVEDSRIDTTIADLSGANFWHTPTAGFNYSDAPGGIAHPALRYKRNVANSVDADKYAIDIEDTYSSSGKVGFLRYASPRSENRAGALISLSTGYGEVFVVDDAGTVLPRDNFADLGSSARRWRSIHLNGSLCRYAATPAQITSDQNAYNPSATTSVWRINSDATRTINGIAGGVNGREILIVNAGVNAIILANESLSAAVSDRILTGSGANITLAQNNSVQIWYDSSTGRWRVTSVRQ